MRRPSRRPPTTALRALRGLVLAFVALLVAALLLLTAVLATTTGARVAVELGLRYYNGLIAGRVSVDAVDGRLGGRFTLRGVMLRDRLGRALLTAEALAVDWSLAALLRGDVIVRSLRLDRPRVHVEGGNFGDLAPATGPEPPDTGPPGPDLPLGLDVALVIRDAAVLGAGDLPIVDGVALDGRLLAAGRAATLDLRAAGARFRDLDLHTLDLRARWSSPVVALERLYARADGAELVVSGARLDVVDLAGALDLHAEVALAAIEPFLSEETFTRLRPLGARLVLSASAQGGPRDMSAELRLRQDPAVELAVRGSGAWSGEKRAAVRLDADLDLAPVTAGELGRVRPALDLRVDPRPGGPLALAAALRCGDCDAAGALSGDLSGTLDRARRDLSLRAALHAVGVDATIDARIAPDPIASRARSGVPARHPGPRPSWTPHSRTGAPAATAQETGARALPAPSASPSTPRDAHARRDASAGPLVLHELDWTLSVPDLARPADLARSLVPGAPTASGALSGRGLCRGPDLRCAGVLELSDPAVAGVAARDVRLDIHARMDRPSGTAFVRVRDLVAGPASAIDRLELSARVAARDPSAPPLLGLPAVDADLAAAALRERPGRPDHARIDLSVTTGPEIHLHLRDLELAARRVALALRAPARLVVRPRSLEVDGLLVDLAPRPRASAVRGRLRVDGLVDLDGASDLRLDLLAFPLAALRPLVPELGLGGMATLRVRLRGLPAAPDFSAALSVAGAGLHRRRLGDLAVALRLRGGLAGADLALTRGLARRVELGARIPLRVDLSRRTWSIPQGPADIELRVDALRLARLAPWLPALAPAGRLDGTLRLAGPIDAPRISSAWRGRELAVRRIPLGDLDLALDHRDDRLVAALDLRRLSALLHADATVPLALDLPRGRVAWNRRDDHRGGVRLIGIDLREQLEALAPGHDLAGRLRLRAELSGPATAPEIVAELRAARVFFRDMFLGSATLDARTTGGASELDLRGGGGRLGRYRLHARAPLAPGVDGLHWRQEGCHTADLDLRDGDLGVLESLAGVEIGGRLGARVVLAGDAHAPQVEGSVRADDLVYRREDVGRLAVRLAVRGGTALLAGDGRFGPRTDLRASARIPLDLDLAGGRIAWRPARPTSLRLDLTGIDADAIDPLRPLPPDVRVDLDLHALAEIDERRVRGRATLAGELGHRLRAAPIAVQLDVDDTRQALRGRIGETGGSDSLNLAADASASIPALRRGDGELLAVPIRGAIDTGGFDLRYIGGLVPASLHDLVGILVADLDLRGTLGAPSFHGTARVRDGGVTIVPLQQRLRDLDLELVADGPRLGLRHLDATSGDGRVGATGALVFAAGGRLSASTTLRLRRFPIVRPGLPQMIVDSHVRAAVKSGPDHLDLSVEVGATEVWVTDLSTRAPDPIPDNPNVEIVRGPLPELAAALDEPAGAGEPAGEEHDPQDMDIRVVLLEPVHIQGPTMDMRWGGRIAVREAGGARVIDGAFTSDRGRFELLGTRFRIDRGRVFLPPEADVIDPFLDLVAGARTPRADVTVTLRGRLSRPELRLSSQPPLTEPQIFSLLVTGTVDSSETDPRKTQASAAGLLVNFSNPTLSRFADQRLGIDRIKLDFADDLSQPVLTIGKYVRKDLYAETTYHHHAPPRHNRIEGRVEYYITPAWSLETSFGDAAVGSIDLFWRHVFGLDRRAPLSRPDTPSPGGSFTPSPRP